MRKTGAIAFTLLILTAVGWGQIPRSGNAFFGYSYSGGQVFNGGAIGVHMNGWGGSVEGKFLPWLGSVADFDWHYGGADTTMCIGTGCAPAKIRLNGSRHSVLFGPRVSTSLGKYTPFAQMFVGFTHQTNAAGQTSASDLAFSTAMGGGLDYKLLQAVSWRGQVDWLRTSLFGKRQHDIRVSTGIVFRF